MHRSHFLKFLSVSIIGGFLLHGLLLLTLLAALTVLDLFGKPGLFALILLFLYVARALFRYLSSLILPRTASAAVSQLVTTCDP
jgi:hypothetical protein